MSHADDDVPDDGIQTLLTSSKNRDAPHALLATVIEGPDTGATFPIDPAAPGRILVGTSPACAIKLTDPSISRRHLAFELAKNRWRVVDLESTNGTAIDGVIVRDAFVRGSEVLRCGATAMRLDPFRASSVPLPTAPGFGRLLGASTIMRRLYPLCERLASSTISVIIEGETGTGKETLAESLHAASGRGEFVVLDCTAISPATIEAELFGCEAGAGVGPARQGCFEQAHGGTLFIDEIGELDLTLQPKLLRALERGEVRRLGAQRSTQVDVRVLVATRRDLDKEVAAGRFRDDLFHRLAVARIELPPLRDRQGDVRLLAQHFAKQLGGAVLGEEVLSRFEADPWPGNVRELRNAVVRSIAVGALSDVQPSMRAEGTADPWPSLVGANWADEILASGAPLPVARRRLVEEFEKRYVQRILAEHDGNVSRAALASGIALRYFQLVKARTNK